MIALVTLTARRYRLAGEDGRKISGFGTIEMDGCFRSRSIRHGWINVYQCFQPNTLLPTYDEVVNLTGLL
jgi:hypothetical protein